ncbi:MAG TPA: ion channel [Bacteroidota bacterium]
MKSMKSIFNNRSRIDTSADEFRDLGLGSKVSNQGGRMINRDGSFNVVRRGLPFLQSLSVYHSLISMSWLKFNLLLVASFVAVNGVFALLYLLAGLEHLVGAGGTTLAERLSEAFFFSTQTFTTVGYGRISPAGFLTNSIATFESMAGWLYFAMAAGLFYGRFSRPHARIIFSRNAIVAPYRGITAFEFRIANERNNQLIDVEAQVLLARREVHNGEMKRKFHPLSLERPQVTFFPLTWTVVHPIDESSPLFGVTQESLAESDAEFLILLKAFDDTFSQTVHARSSYKHDEVVVGAAFGTIYGTDAEGKTTVALHRIHDIERVEIQQIQSD